MTATKARAEILKPIDTSKQLVCKIGTLLCVLPEDRIEAERVAKNFKNFANGKLEELVEALEMDVRVAEVYPLIGSTFNAQASVYFPRSPSGDDDEILLGHDGFYGLDFGAYIDFVVNVPRKNQPRRTGTGGIPAETYFVRWDGLTAYVLWEQDDDDPWNDGGLVVKDILSDAARGVGGFVYNQACAANCENVFMHTSIWIERKDVGLGNRSAMRDGDEFIVSFRIPAEVDNFAEVLDEVYDELSTSAQTFLEFKNTVARLRTVEHVVRARLNDLLRNYYEEQSWLTKPIRERVSARAERRAKKKEMRATLASVWVGLASIETLKRSGDEHMSDFADSVSKNQRSLLFRKDIRDDEDALKSLDIERIETLASQMSTRIDSGAAARATIGGAMAGGVAGGVLSVTANLIGG